MVGTLAWSLCCRWLTEIDIDSQGIVAEVHVLSWADYGGGALSTHRTGTSINDTVKGKCFGDAIVDGGILRIT